MFAYCYQSGLIEFGRSVPKGALPIIKGRPKQVRRTVEATAVLAYDNETLLVPGVGTAKTELGKYAAYCHYRNWLLSRESKNAG